MSELGAGAQTSVAVPTVGGRGALMRWHDVVDARGDETTSLWGIRRMARRREKRRDTARQCMPAAMMDGWESVTPRETPRDAR